MQQNCFNIVNKNEMNKLSEIKENSWRNTKDKLKRPQTFSFRLSIQLDFELNASCNLRCPYI